MDRDAVLRKVTEIVVQEMRVAPGTVTEATDFESDLGADSIDRIYLLVAVEMEYALEIEESDALRLKTVGELVDYLAGRNQ